MYRYADRIAVIAQKPESALDNYKYRIGITGRSYGAEKLNDSLIL